MSEILPTPVVFPTGDKHFDRLLAAARAMPFASRASFLEYHLTDLRQLALLQVFTEDRNADDLDEDEIAELRQERDSEWESAAVNGGSKALVNVESPGDLVTAGEEVAKLEKATRALVDVANRIIVKYEDSKNTLLEKLEEAVNAAEEVLP